MSRSTRSSLSLKLWHPDIVEEFILCKLLWDDGWRKIDTSRSHLTTGNWQSRQYRAVVYVHFLNEDLHPHDPHKEKHIYIPGGC